MNTMFPRFISFLLSLTALTLISSALSAKADIITSAPTESSESTMTLANSDRVSMPTSNLDSVQAVPTETSNLQSANSTRVGEVQPTISSATPIIGTATTSANDLKAEPTTTSQTEIRVPEETQVPQTDIELGRATRSGSSYIGVAGNIGIGGDTALGRGNFTVISKIGLTRTLSVRPAAILGDDTVFLIPVTYDFTPRTTDPFERVSFAPYVGAGAMVSTGDDTELGFLVSGGVDFPINRQFTATAGVNVGFKNNTEAGLLLGIGYNFSGF